MPPLTPKQHHAIDWVLGQLKAGTPVCAIHGLAGTGKSTLIPYLYEAVTAGSHGDVAIGTPTHRAAAVLRAKGMHQAQTVHALALTLRCSQPYEACEHWLAASRCEPEVPPLLQESLAMMAYDGVAKPPTAQEVYARMGRYDARTVLASVGIHFQHHIIGYGPKDEAGDVLIVDEGSMVGKEMLDLCQHAYKQVVLIGDHGQLPPVQDTPVLWQVPAVMLTDVHRQAEHSPILSLAYAVRHGAPLRAPEHGGDAIHALPAHSATAAMSVPLLVWRNKVRLQMTALIRAMLGYPATRLLLDEPLVCRAHSQKHRLMGLYNNGLYRVVEVLDADGRTAVIREEMSGDTCTVLLHIEEWDGAYVDPDAVPFRLGYCLTVHTAQGSEWDTVAILVPEATAYRESSLRRGEQDEAQRWTYTAVTRARQRLCLVTQNRVEA